MLLKQRTYFIKEHVGFGKLVDTYDILHPQTQALLGVAREEPPGWAKWLRLLINKKLMPTRINVYEKDGTPPVLSLHRDVALFRTKVTVSAADGRQLGHFKKKVFTLGGAFVVFNHTGQEVAEISGDWKGWNFKITAKGGAELGTVTKKWAGLGKEFFTSADNYVIALNDAATSGSADAALLLAAGLAIDTVFKENN